MELEGRKISQQMEHSILLLLLRVLRGTKTTSSWHGREGKSQLGLGFSLR